MDPTPIKYNFLRSATIPNDTIESAKLEKKLTTLLRELSPDAPDLILLDLMNMAGCNHLAVAWEERDGKLGKEQYPVGMAALCPQRKWAGWSGTIEDVVVAKTHRRLGIGRALTQMLIDEAKKLGLRHLDLTSRATRREANMLYQSLGFRQRDTNYYRLKLT